MASKAPSDDDALVPLTSDPSHGGHAEPARDQSPQLGAASPWRRQARTCVHDAVVRRAGSVRRTGARSATVLPDETDQPDERPGSWSLAQVPASESTGASVGAPGCLSAEGCQGGSCSRASVLRPVVSPSL
jgi:hypothetical protein